MESSVKTVFYENEMKVAYIDYAHMVITGRALPDVRDGLKPVHRRIIYCMDENKYTHDKSHKKSARVIGDIMGKYHPHGDSAIYEAMARLTRKWVMLHPLIDGQGNFGSLDGDSAAAMRYTEARLDKISDYMLTDINKNVVPFVPNYDESEVEPTVLPTVFPNLLVNGSEGIAVGLACSFPPHNLSEVIDATVAYMKNKEISLEELLKIMPAPDFPTGGLVSKDNSLKNYENGNGPFVICSKHHIETVKGKNLIVITEIPYGVNKVKLQEKIIDLVNEKVITGISDVRDESDRQGIRIVIELKKDTDPESIVIFLKDKTEFMINFNLNMTCLNSQGEPKLLGLKDILKEFVKFREECVIKRTEFDLFKTMAELNKQLGLYVAASCIDEVIKMIRGSNNTDEARQKLLDKKFNVTEELAKFLKESDPDRTVGQYYELNTEQTNAILALRINQLTKLEQGLLIDKCKEYSKEINRFKKILNNKHLVTEIIENELVHFKQLFGKPRQSQLIEKIEKVKFEQVVGGQNVTVSISKEGYMRSLPQGSKLKPDLKNGDVFVKHFDTDTAKTLVIFTNDGKYYPIKVADIQDKSRALVNYANYTGKIIATYIVNPDDQLLFVTDFGDLRRNQASDFTTTRNNIAMKLESGNVINIHVVSENQTVVLGTKTGNAVRFMVNEVSLIGSKNSTGVRGIKLKDDDVVVSSFITDNNDITIEERMAYSNKGTAEYEGRKITLTKDEMKKLSENEKFYYVFSENGYAKMISSYDIKITGRGIQGVRILPKDIKLFGLYHTEKTHYETNEGTFEFVNLKKNPRDGKGVKTFDNLEFLNIFD